MTLLNPSLRYFVCFQWKSGQVVHLGWTVSEDLICIQEDGTVLIYDIFCVFKRTFTMGNVSKHASNSMLKKKIIGEISPFLYYYKALRSHSLAGVGFNRRDQSPK